MLQIMVTKFHEKKNDTACLKTLIRIHLVIVGDFNTQFLY